MPSCKRFVLAATLLFVLLGSSIGVAAVYQNDMSTGADAGDTFGTASLISAGTGTGYLYEQYDPHEEDLHDFYKIYVGANQIISASVTPVEDSSVWYLYIDVDLNLYDTGGTLLRYSALGGQQTDSVTFTVTGDYSYPAGYYVIDVSWLGSAATDKSGYYELEVSVAGQTDMNTGGDAGDSFDDASLITAGSGTGYLDDMDYEDYYKISLSAGQTININMAPPSGSDFDLYLSNPYQIDLFDAQSTNSGDAAESVSYAVTSAGTYYIRVEMESGSGTYSMTVALTGGDGDGDITSENIQASTGGTVEKGDAQVEIPAYALAQDTTITMQVTTAAAPTGFTAVSSVYEIGPSGTSFNIPSTITLPYNESALPAGVGEENLAIYRQSGAGWEKIGGTVNTFANTVTAQISQLSKYAVMAPGAGAAAGDELPWMLIAGVVVVIIVLIGIGAALRRRPYPTGPPETGPPAPPGPEPPPATSK